ncbi:hypothetical protein KC909_03250 [Candidatus Dojkabacteria bacterium]|uniref:Uncharacterized protein n=1 Tax=Candidatus Dojkabacteria bacterium TaxID=2099670 RepID=A0A955L614_9BACT|nr:hypothetical protein [Candidatus Dojkabacteria bacterium]
MSENPYFKRDLARRYADVFLNQSGYPGAFDALAGRFDEATQVLNTHDQLSKGTKLELLGHQGFWEGYKQNWSASQSLAAALNLVALKTGFDLRFNSREYAISMGPYALSIWETMHSSPRMSCEYFCLNDRELQEAHNLISQAVRSPEYILENLGIMQRQHGQDSAFEPLLAQLTEYEEYPMTSNQAIIRSFPTCTQQVLSLRQVIAESSASVSLVIANGYLGNMHNIGVLLPNNPAVIDSFIAMDSQLVSQNQGTSEGFISWGSIIQPRGIDFDAITIVDPSIVQFTRFQKMMHAGDKVITDILSPQDGLNLVRDIAPDFITEDGVFIGPASMYIYLACHLGTDDPVFEVDKSFLHVK